MLILCTELVYFLLLAPQVNSSNPAILERNEQALLEAAAHPETEGPASLELARLYAEHGRLDQALTFAKAAAANMPENSDAHTELARAISAKMSRDPMFAMSHLELFWNSIEKAIGLNPKNFQAWRLKIGFQLYAPPIAGGSLEAAKQTLAQTREIDEELGLFLEAAVLEREEKHEERLAVFRQLAARSPKNRDYLMQIGFALLSLARFDQASMHFENLFAQDPTDSECLYRAARAKVMGETQLDTAVQQLEQYIDLVRETHPGSAAKAYCQIGLAQNMRQKPDLARNAYHAALELDPENQAAMEALKSLDSD